MFKVFLCIASDHNLWLVGVAAVVCVVATLATFFLYSRVPSFPVWRRWTWLAMTGLVAGSGIWTTHFVAMLAFKTGLPTGYAVLGTMGSLVVAIVGTTVGFACGSSPVARCRPALFAICGGLAVGLGITFMHYVGMSGYRTEGRLQWDAAYVVASVLIGAILSAAALYVARPGADWRHRIAGAALLTLGIVGMHFTGMTAVTIVPDPSIAVPAEIMSDAAMVIAAVAVTALILITAIGGVAFDTASRNGNLRRLREALDVMPEGLAFYDAADRLIAWNTRYADLCRAAGATLVPGMAFSELLQTECSHGAYPDAAGREDEWLAERWAAHVRKQDSLTQRMAAGRWLRITERETADGGTVCVSVDITELKRAESQLRQAQAEAQAAAAVKAEFLANMSHELRTPLTSIIGFTGLASEQADLSELTRSYVDRVGDASRALLCTVNDILDFSKLEAGQVTIQPQPVSLRSLTSAALNLFTPQAGAKDLRLTLDDQSGCGDVVVALDPDRIRQILLNLVGNAVKFTKTGGVTLRTRYDPASAMLGIDVVDTGEGIPTDKQDRLFKRFSQVDGSLTRVQGGTGLGLAICKGLVEAMGGQIGVESQVGEGSRFWFTVPAPAATIAKPSSADAGADRTRVVGVRVLVADDHPTNRELARLVLTGVGAEITEAADGEEAARLAFERPFDVILMDLRMPKLDGIGALKRVRARPGPNDATPILAFTADADAENRERLAELGFQDVVSKPLEAGVLIASVARAAAYPPRQPPADIADAA
jgi:signal transduction histidine kinase/ActR/RegA family two-component response regulator